MISFVYILIGAVSAQILKSGGITPNMWQFYGIAGCLIATVITTVIMIKLDNK